MIQQEEQRQYESKNDSHPCNVLDVSSCRSRHTESSDSMQVPRWKDNQDYELL